MKQFFSRLLGAVKNIGKSTEEDSLPKTLNIDERDMIRGVVELSETYVKEIMVPRIDVISLSADTDEQTLITKTVESGHSRFPVFQETIDNVIGIIYIKDIMKKLAHKEKLSINDISRTAYFVPESMRLDILLKEMKRRHVHIAIVVDEYGGMSGIACLEDILEEIIGDIQDEFDNEPEDIIKVGEGVYLCDARLSIDDLNTKVQLNLPDEDFDTLGGFVFDLFGKIPVKFEKVIYDQCVFIIQEMDAHKIRSVKLLVTRSHESTED